jgi:signal transduction histidine kinase
MQFRPFGRDSQGRTIQDVSGITVRANLEYLEDLVSRDQGREAGRQTLDRLVTLLNERIPDKHYHVTLDFLKNPWNSYSYEFVMFLAEFSVQLSQQEHFHFNLGREKFLSPIIQILGRPFSIVQIYRLYPYFVEKFTKGSLKPEVRSVTNGHAVMRLTISEHGKEQFGAYFQGCADRICATTKAAIAEVPARMFGRPPATIQDTCCMADGAPFCEWTFTWIPQGHPMRTWHLASIAAGLLSFGLVATQAPGQPLWIATGAALLTVFILQLAGRLRVDRTELQQQRKIIQEQLESAEHRHEELRAAYANQEHIVVEMRRRVEELTMLHELTIKIGSTLDTQVIIQAGIQAIVDFLTYHDAWFAAYEVPRQVFHDIRMAMSPSLIQMVEQEENLPPGCRTQLHAMVRLQEPVFIENAQELWDPQHPLTQQWFTGHPPQSCLLLPLFNQHHLLGILGIGKSDHAPFETTERNLLVTVGHQLAIALDSALAYREIETLNLGLEVKVRERTAELQQVNKNLELANERLKELDRLKSKFLSHCSHELRTPLTSIKGFTENLLHGMAGGLSERQLLYLSRINANSDRLTRMIGDLLDLSRIEAGTIRLDRKPVSLSKVLEEATQELLPLTQSKNQQLVLEFPPEELTVTGDADRLHQIIINLIHNAHKFTPNQGVIRVHAILCPPHLIVTISDTGPGIPKEAQNNLFLPFFQAHRHPEIGTQGLGLGLSIVKQLVDLHGGSISVESEEGKGTTFRMLLPASVST